MCRGQWVWSVTIFDSRCGNSNITDNKIKDARKDFDNFAFKIPGVGKHGILP